MLSVQHAVMLCVQQALPLMQQAMLQNHAGGATILGSQPLYIQTAAAPDMLAAQQQQLSNIQPVTPIKSMLLVLCIKCALRIL